MKTEIVGFKTKGAQLENSFEFRIWVFRVDSSQNNEIIGRGLKPVDAINDALNLLVGLGVPESTVLNMAATIEKW